ncbi:MAG TPA: hypothetical protein VNS46_10505 [Nocardioides sp.]|nr:hypothetical protein [Nocardioides sp.]
MTSLHRTADPVTRSTSASAEDAGAARRASRMFLGSFVGFVGIVITSAAVDSARDTAQREAADELDVNLNHLPADVLARILQEDSSTVATVLNLVFATISVVLFAAAIHALVGVPGARGAVARGAVALAVVGGLSWLGMNAAELALRSEPGWLMDNWWIYMTLVAVFVIAACLALMTAVACLWGTGRARRTGIVVIAICALTIVAQLTVNAPPIVPMLLGAIYAFNVARAVRTAA